MRVFLSSTYRDLIKYRKKAAEAVELLGQQAGRMEMFGAQPREPKDACLREIDQSDSFVGIYAFRYGYIPEGSKISITEIEFQHALERNKPIYCFVADDSYGWPNRMIEGLPGKRKLAKFKKEIRTRYTCKSFTTPEDLGMKIAASLGRYGNEISAPVYALGSMVRSMAAESDEERGKASAALEAAVSIANKTFQYIEELHRTGKRNYEEQRSLAAGWSAVGLQLTRLKNPPIELAERYFLKAQYWSSPQNWSDEWIRSSKIGLEEIAADSRQFLLPRATEREKSKSAAKKASARGKTKPPTARLLGHE